MNHRGSSSLTVLGLCCSTALSLACNAEDSNNKGRKDTPDVSSSSSAVAPVQRETCDDNPLLAECLAAAPAPSASSAGAGPARAATTAPKSDPAALAKAAAENVLASNCGQCHGPALTPDQAKAGMNYINDIDQLVATGKIVPLDSAGSRVVQRMLKGEMPPVDSGLPRVTDADVETVASYIDNPVFWPKEVQPGDCEDKGQVTDFDTLFQTANLDLRRQDSKDQPFLRYISLSNRFTAGVCSDGGLDKDRQGLTKMLNMLSVNAVIREPTPIDKDKTLYRIDLRDLNWDRALSVNGQNFNDVWEAIAANNPYAVKFVGDDADDLEGDAKTDFPIMMADQMLDVAVIGNLYYGIIAVDVNQPLANFISTDLGIDLQANLDDRRQLRAGTTRSRISRQDRLVERDDIEVRNGALWQSFDFEANGANDSIFQDPFGFAAGGTEAIFTLPNGMLGFIIANANDNIVEDSDILLDTNQDNFRAVTAVSCSNCHSGGLIPVVDEVAPADLASARALGLNRDEVEQLQEIYASPQTFADQVKQDSQSFFQRALTLASVPTSGGDPVSSVWLRFDSDVKLADAAGDLGLAPDDLLDNLELLNPVLSVLKKDTLDRDDFTAVYIDSLCILSQPSENQPDAAACAAAAQAAGN